MVRHLKKVAVGILDVFRCGSTTGSDYRAIGSRPQETGGDYRDVGGRPQETGVVHRGTEATEETSDSDDRKMAPKRRTTRLNPKTTLAVTTATTTTVTNAQLQAMIDQGVTAILAARDANTNGVDSHNSRIDARRNERATQLRTQPKKLEVELWDLKVKESDKIERYVGGLPDMIHGSVVASKPKTMQEATEIATELMDKRIRTFAERQTENKRKQDNNQQQQPQNKRQNTGMAYAAGTGEKKLYGGSKPLCPKCNYHHDGPCAPKCHKCNRIGHLARDCRSPAYANTIYPVIPRTF
ncbi:reverse transcriptase domain-containing protein [Tanacetum coccineum]